MSHKGFIGSFAISALLVSAAVALLIVTAAMLAFDGFPGPSLEEATEEVRTVSVAPGARPKPELVLDPPSAGALIPGAGAQSADASVAAEAVSGTPAATGSGTGTVPAPDAPTIETAVPPGDVPTVPTDPTAPELPGGDTPDDPADAIGSSTPELPSVPGGLGDLVGGGGDGDVGPL